MKSPPLITNANGVSTTDQNTKALPKGMAGKKRNPSLPN